MKPGPSKLVCVVAGLFTCVLLACGAEQRPSASTISQSGSGGESSLISTGGVGEAGMANASGVGAGGSNSTTSANGYFSFFVTSYRAIAVLSGTAQGFGGDLRFGETGDGAGLRGADKICTAVAERSAPGNGKVWRAFLSTSEENAIDRIGEGPFYDRRGRLVAAHKLDLLATRPIGADRAIINDLPNEDGTPNHSPDGTLVDNHDTLTGTNKDGGLYGPDSACSDWTSAVADNTKPPRVGHTWPSISARDHITGGATGNIEGMAHWISALNESGCGVGVNLIETGSPSKDGTVGSGGGYGGIYCFALTP